MHFCGRGIGIENCNILILGNVQAQGVGMVKKSACFLFWGIKKAFRVGRAKLPPFADKEL
mgnify:CR=1 FL=1